MLNVMMSNFLSLMTIVVMATLASQHPYEDMQLLRIQENFVACRIESKCFFSIFIFESPQVSGGIMVVHIVTSHNVGHFPFW